MKGDQADMVARLRLTLPETWFADRSPVLGGVLAGLGVAWSGLYGILQQVRLESRLATVTGQFLDLACSDYFGERLGRRLLEEDAPLRQRLRQAMRRYRGTRAGLIDAASQAGFVATVFEPACPADTGAYSVAAGLAWGVAGGWGSLQMPLECLVVARATVAVGDVGQEIADSLPAGGVAWLRIVT